MQEAPPPKKNPQVSPQFPVQLPMYPWTNVNRIHFLEVVVVVVVLGDLFLVVVEEG